MAKVVVIPARYASSRFPGKLLRDDSGWPLIRHVYERCLKIRGVDRVVVAVDGRELEEAVRSFQGEVVRTHPDLESGTDRVAAAVKELGLDSSSDHVVNVQGDEPQIDPGHVEHLFDLVGEDGVEVATLAVPRTDQEGFDNPNRVKVVRDLQGLALYFSRSGIPRCRDAVSSSTGDAGVGASVNWLLHVGVYGFRPDALRRFAETAPTPLERTERLEQLRFLEMGMSLRVGLVSGAAPGIDTPEDYERFLRSLGD